MPTVVGLDQLTGQQVVICVGRKDTSNVGVGDGIDVIGASVDGVDDKLADQKVVIEVDESKDLIDAGFEDGSDCSDDVTDDDVVELAEEIAGIEELVYQHTSNDGVGEGGSGDGGSSDGGRGRQQII